MEYCGEDISGNETGSVLRKLKDCFKETYYDEWAGFHNQGYPAASQHRHMMRHSQFRQTDKPHGEYWYQESEENFIQEYINRHHDESVLQVLDEDRKDTVYGCSDPRLHIKSRDQVNR